MNAFSSRLPEALGPNALTRAVARLRDAGVAWLDLTETNPTVVGLPYPTGLLQPLAGEAGLTYAPDSTGLASARAAVAAEYARRGVRLTSDRVVLTASTSEAYAWLFKLLCDPGDAVLVPQPSYPLFDLLTSLEAVGAQPYRLEYHGQWGIDRESLLAALTPRSKAVLVVAPNNPTGSMLRADDRTWLWKVCSQRGLAIIADEVFADYPLCRRGDAVSAMGDAPVLTFSLGGLSKSAGLPQLKLGWIALDGPAPAVESARQRLELIADTYLSVSTPVQLSAARLIESGRTMRDAIATRLARNLQQLRSAAAGHPALSLLEPEGGWSAVLRVPAVESEEALVLRLLQDAHVLVHPGYFFDFPTEAFLVISLLPESAVFATAIDRVVASIAFSSGAGR